MKLGRSTVVAGLLAALAPAAGMAESSSHDLLTPFGAYLLAGGGVTNYFSSSVRNQLNSAGGTWDLRLGIGDRHFIGGELGYNGSALKAGSLGKDLFSDGLEGVVRVQYPYADGHWLVEPFAFGGVGWTHFDITQSTGAAIRNTQDVFVMPLGGGVTFAYDRILLDTRFTYRQTFNESLIREPDGSAAKMNNWAVTAAVGYEF